MKKKEVKYIIKIGIDFAEQIGKLPNITMNTIHLIYHILISNKIENISFNTLNRLIIV